MNTENLCPLCGKTNSPTEWVCKDCGVPLPNHGKKQPVAVPAKPASAVAPEKSSRPLSAPRQHTTWKAPLTENATFRFGIICALLGVIGVRFSAWIAPIVGAPTKADRDALNWFALWPALTLMLSLLAVVVGIIAIIVGVVTRNR